MGKKMRKKAARAGQKDKRAHASSPKDVPLDQNPDTKDVNSTMAPAVNEKRGCPHLVEGMDLSNVSSKLCSVESFACEDCREGALDRRSGRGKGKQTKKKGKGGSDSKCAIWVCLECGHFACGGVGLPSTHQTHAILHARQSKHPLVIQAEKPLLRWCFPCSTLIPVEKSEEGGTQKDLLSDIVKLLKKQPSESASLDVEDVWFGSGTVVSETKMEKNTLSNHVNRQDVYAVRGLSNLGNTCFFNSVLQNLLATNSLRECLLKLEDPTGPLTCSLKKLYGETSPDAGLTSVVNPRSLFGSVCARAPQFKGYQQQDSHELLRYLLDGLATEDLKSRKSNNTSSGNENRNSSHPTPQSFVDEIFGGQLSSTVCCKACSHSSVVHEPFLDLSLSVPTKKPHSKRVQSVSRTRKTKPPPKRLGKNRPKINNDKNANSLHVAHSDSLPSMTVDSSGSCKLITGNEANNDALPSGSGSGSGSASLQSGGDNVIQNGPIGSEADPADSTWMDFLEPLSLENEPAEIVAFSADNYTSMDLAEPDEQVWGPTKCDGLSIIQASSMTDPGQIDEPSKDTGTVSDDGLLSLDEEANNTKFDSAPADPWEDDVPIPVGDSVVLLLPYTDESSTHVGDPVYSGDVGPSSSALSGAAGEEGLLDFDGFGDMFNEPECSSGPGAESLSEPNGALENGYGPKNISESDPDEVDNSDSPVSVESCLFLFTKPEDLTQEHAWHCENCSKIALKQKRKLRKKSQMRSVSTITESNGGNCFPHVKVSEADKMNGVGCGPHQTSKKLELGEEGAETFSNGATLDEAGLSNYVCVASSQPIGQDVDQCANKTSELTEEHESGQSDEDEVGSKSAKVMRDATKRMMISKLPPVLTIHLNRFSQDARLRLSKLTGHVVFKEVIDLESFVDPRSKDKGGEYKYRLIGVVEHMGSMRGGHYVAYIRGGTGRRGGEEEEGKGCGVWYYASDSHVREVSLQEVLRCEAYILFYEKL